LNEAADYQEAFRTYERLVQPYVEERQKNARDFAKSFVPKSRLGVLAQQMLMKLILACYGGSLGWIVSCRSGRCAAPALWILAVSKR
jgi:2-polyprenyl-6-methoxyphenol hydroxylase-like FAD-dependent oxidoreductase